MRIASISPGGDTNRILPSELSEEAVLCPFCRSVRVMSPIMSPLLNLNWEDCRGWYVGRVLGATSDGGEIFLLGSLSAEVALSNESCDADLKLDLLLLTPE